ncbi:MAG: CHRD domain-containing protein [Gemmatimonadaceae bacterium]
MIAIGRWLRVSGVVAALSVAAGGAGAQTWTADMSGPAESPANNSPGTGHAEFTLAGNNLSVFITFQNLLAGTTASHIHCCTASPFTGVAGIATVVPTFTDFPLGVTSGTYQRIFDLTDASSFNPAFIAANGGTVEGARAALVAGMNAGDAYVNVHSAQFPAGEIRGFLVTVPEPGTLTLLGAGLAVLGTVAKRRREGRGA